MTTDETTETKQGEETSAGKEGSTSDKETPTLTASQGKAMENKARSDALSEVGRLRKAAEDSSKIAQSAIQRLQKIEEDQLKAEEEDAKDDPPKLSAIQLRRQAMDMRKEVAEETQKTVADRAEIQTQRTEIKQHNAERFSEKYNVTEETLLEYGGDTKTTMERLAKSYGDRTVSSGEEPGTEANRMTSPPDSGKTKGTGVAGKKPTLEEVQAVTPKEYDAKVKSGEWTPFA